MKSSNQNPKRKRTTKNSRWEANFALLRQAYQSQALPSLNRLTEGGSTPWQILVATILSLRTRDDVTLAASRRLFALAPDPEAVRQLDQEQLASTIFPVGFYRTKAKQILEIAYLLKSRNDEVPRHREELLQFPGVGRKTANLVLNLAFGVEAICVDTHVHRIPNRLGWIETQTPEESEAALESLWPRQHWIEANALLVSFGQTVCTPIGPRCSICPFREHCFRRGVKTSR